MKRNTQGLSLFEISLTGVSNLLIVSAIQSVCPHYTVSKGRTGEDSCYTCSYFPSIKDRVAICRCEKMRKTIPVNAGIMEEMI